MGFFMQKLKVIVYQVRLRLHECVYAPEAENNLKVVGGILYVYVSRA